jgi:hypothetical protein
MFCGSDGPPITLLHDLVEHLISYAQQLRMLVADSLYRAKGYVEKLKPSKFNALLPRADPSHAALDVATRETSRKMSDDNVTNTNTTGFEVLPGQALCNR